MKRFTAILGRFRLTLDVAVGNETFGAQKALQRRIGHAVGAQSEDFIADDIGDRSYDETMVFFPDGSLCERVWVNYFTDPVFEKTRVEGIYRIWGGDHKGEEWVVDGAPTVSASRDRRLVLRLASRIPDADEGPTDLDRIQNVFAQGSFLRPEAEEAQDDEE